MEQDAEEKMEETKEDIDEAVHNPVSTCSIKALSCAAESLVRAARCTSHTTGTTVMSWMLSSSIVLLRWTTHAMTYHMQPALSQSAAEFASGAGNAMSYSLLPTPICVHVPQFSAAQGVSLQRALSDGAARLQEGPLKGPSTALDNMSAAAKDLKQKVSSDPGSCDSLDPTLSPI